MREFAVTPPGKGTWLFVVAICVAIPIAVMGGILGSGGARADWLAIAILAPVMLGVALLLLACIRRRRVRVVGPMLEIHAAFYTQRIPLADLDLAGAQVVDLRERTEFRPSWKSNGFNAPGMLAGHFRGRRFARQFLLVTDKRRVLALPQLSGRMLLLSLERPQELLKTLRGD